MTRILLLLLLILCLSGSAHKLGAEGSLLFDAEEELDQIPEFPIEPDALDEFIQSYYALLESDTYLKQYGFIKQRENRLFNDAALAKTLYPKLARMRAGLPENVCIYQIGDSHIKPGYFSTTTRSSLLKFFQPGMAVDEARLQYHFTGINGASFFNLTPNDAIFERMSTLNPDLIVISLGTNDAQGTYDASRFRKQMQGFMERLTSVTPDVLIIFTLPADSYKKNKHNSDIEKVSREIQDYAKAKGYAWWDMYGVMGGKNSISQWRQRDFASKDMVHFSPQGYMLQGYLFYHALMDSYKKYTEGGR